MLASKGKADARMYSRMEVEAIRVAGYLYTTAMLS